MDTGGGADRKLYTVFLWTDPVACNQCCWDLCRQGKDTKKHSHEVKS